MPDQMWHWLDDFPQQVEHAAQLAQNWDFKNTEKPAGIAFLGIGGSAIGATLITDLFADSFNCPVVVQRGDTPPSWLREGCLAVAVSYSGETRETLTSFQRALHMGATGITLSSGGTLAKLAQDGDLPHLIIPSGMAPRAALGYSSIPLIYLLQKMNAISADEFHVDALVRMLASIRVEWGETTGTGAGIARRLMKRLPIIVGAGLTTAVSRRFQAQLAENSKALSVTFEIPEALHNLVETLGRGDIESFRPIAVYLEDTESPEELRRLQKHVRATFQEAGIESVVITTEGTSPLERLFSVVHKIDWISYHLAILCGIDPIAIPVITAIKEKSSLKKQ